MGQSKPSNPRDRIEVDPDAAKKLAEILKRALSIPLNVRPRDARAYWGWRNRERLGPFAPETGNAVESRNIQIAVVRLFQTELTRERPKNDAL